MKPKLAPTALTAMLALAAVSYSLQGAAESATKAPAQAAAAAAGAPVQAATTGGGGQATPATSGQAAPTNPVPAGVTTVKPGQTIKLGAKRGGPGKPPPPAKPPKPPWELFKLDRKKTMFLDFTDANADMILSIFSRTSGITILKDPSFKTTLTLTSAKSVGLADAFEILNTALDLNGYELTKRGKLMVVGKKSAAPPPQPPPMPTPPPAPPPDDDKPILHVYKLANANASQVARVVNEVFSQQQLEAIVKQLQQGGGFQPGQPNFGGGPQGPQQPKVVRASSEDYTNSVIVNAPKKYQEDVKNLIDQLDVSSAQPLESEIFKMSYIPADDAVDAIQNVLTANTPTGRGAGKQSDQNQNNYGYFYNPFRSSQSSATSGGQSAIAVKQTNSVIVNATKENMVLIRKLISDMDKESAFVGTTFVIHLQNAKASDVATLLNQAFTKPRNSQNDNPFFFIYSDSYGSDKKTAPTTDVSDDGKIVNIRDLTGKVNVIADPNTNSLIVVTQPSNMRLIQKIVDQIDAISDQVMIETIIVEANLDKTTKLGVEWNFLQNKAFNQGGTTGTGKQTFGIQDATTPPADGFLYSLTGKNYGIFLNAVQNDTRFKVLSTPRIFTSNNVQAKVDVGQQVPYITAQQTATTVGGLISNYDFKAVGDTLTVTPRITAAGEVAMDVVQTADDLQGFTTYNAPIINHRQTQTTVSVKDGDTIVLGGIIRSTVNITNNKIPFLGDLPLLGPLFRSTSHNHQTTELMVLLTPHIIHSAAEAQRLREQEQKQLSPTSLKDLKNIIPPQGPIKGK